MKKILNFMGEKYELQTTDKEEKPMTVKEFQQSGFEDGCWIQINEKVLLATYHPDYDLFAIDIFYVDEKEIKYVWPIIKPEPVK